MIRAVLKEGFIQPTEEMPDRWEEGQELVVEADDDAKRLKEDDLALWTRQIAEAAAGIPDEDHELFLAAIAAHRSDSKESIRRHMGLA